jgi:hypothetical protein
VRGTQRNPSPGWDTEPADIDRLMNDLRDVAVA